MIVKSGTLPADITGHMFIVGTVGHDSTYRPNTDVVYPSSDGFTPMYNGDGMIYRLDFDRPSQVTLTTRIAKAPCYYADIATSKLATNAITQLYHPQMNFGFTVHTTWMPKIARRTASYNVPVREDYQNVVSQQPDYIQELFNHWVYPQREF